MLFRVEKATRPWACGTLGADGWGTPAQRPPTLLLAIFEFGRGKFESVGDFGLLKALSGVVLSARQPHAYAGPRRASASTISKLGWACARASPCSSHISRHTASPFSRAKSILDILYIFGGFRRALSVRGVAGVCQVGRAAALLRDVRRAVRLRLVRAPLPRGPRPAQNRLSRGARSSRARAAFDSRTFGIHSLWPLRVCVVDGVESTTRGSPQVHDLRRYSLESHVRRA